MVKSDFFRFTYSLTLKLNQGLTRDPLDIFKIWLFHERFQQNFLRMHFSFYLINSFYKF